MIRFLLFLICIQLGHGYPGGAPSSTCVSMMPQHDVTPKPCQSNYIIQAEKSIYDTNDRIRITVRGATNNDHFKGILLTAKNEHNQQMMGTWSTTSSSVKTISCNKTENTAITHSSADDKSEVVVVWQAPPTVSTDNIKIKATIVKSYDEIYVDCFSTTLTSKRSISKRSTDTQSANAHNGKDISTKTNTNVEWEYANHTLTVTMTTEQVSLDEWRSIGFSLDQQMGDEYVFICQVSSTGDALLRRMHTKLGKQPPSPTHEDVHVISAAYEDGRLTCHFSFETNSAQADGEPAPIAIDKNYYLLFGAGQLRTEEQLAKHNLTFVSSKTFQLQNPENINLDELVTTPTTTVISSASTRSSIASSIFMTTTTPVAQTKNINVNITWTYANGSTHVKMTVNNLKTSQWIAMGLSLDELMGEDHVFICQHLSDNTVSLQRYVNPDGHARPVLASTIAKPGGNLSISREKLENGVVYCEFTLSNFVDAKRRARQNDFPALSLTASYRPLIAFGNMDSSNNLIRHSRSERSALPQHVSLNRQETIIYKVRRSRLHSTSLMKAHGIIMVFAWLVLVSTGILIARYFKRSWPDRKLCGKAVWFALHRTIMASVATLTLIAFILILVYQKGKWVPSKYKREFAHSITGILVVCFALIQPLMALFRCHPDDRYRFIFNYVHATVGLSAFILSIAAIFLATFFTEYHFHETKGWAILVAWSCWLPLIFVIFEMIEIYFQKYSSSVEKANAFAMVDRNGNGMMKTEPVPAKETAKQSRIKGLFLSLHIILAFGLALALIILIGKS